MAIRLRRPTDAHLRELLRAAPTQELTYAPIGISRGGDAPGGYHVARWSRSLGRSPEVFERACDAIRRWQVHRGSGILVCADGPPTVGEDVAMAAPLPLGYIDVVCRVVAVEDSDGRFGFTYGTLPVHPETGEESFTVTRGPDGDVVFEVVAAAKPRQILARTFPPVSRLLQRQATARYLDAMQDAVSPHPPV